ncbi:hypothetical protein SAMN02745866_02108 [Alteromonadaceae bacterium Bs31]|nr:hypothetical protein SAMN02745866_02108 [Alteromonadaceae bacterium Bs31]
MIHFPHNTPLNYSHTSVEQRSEVTVERNSSEGQSLKLSYSERYQYSQTTYTPGKLEPALTYQPDSASNSASNSASEAADTNKSSAVEAAPEVARNDAANTILAFIDQRLATDLADGADIEALQSRLAAGLEGFMKGFQEAYDQLSEMGLMEGAVKTAVEQSFNQVITGFAELAEKYGLENPAADLTAFEAPAEELDAVAEVPSETVADKQQPVELIQPFVEELKQNQEAEKLSTLIAPTQDFYEKLDEEKSESRLYSFQLRTADGDVVSIRSYADQGERIQNFGDSSVYDSDSMQDFQMRVEGDLDTDELRAINELLSQLNDVAGEFFEGNVYQAYEKALEVGFDSEEIARFSLNLSQTQYHRIEESYGSVARADQGQTTIKQGEMEQVNRVSQLGEFVQRLQAIQEQASAFDPRQLPELADFVSRPRYGEHHQFEQFKPFIEKMIGAMS